MIEPSGASVWHVTVSPSGVSTREIRQQHCRERSVYLSPGILLDARGVLAVKVHAVHVERQRRGAKEHT